MRPLRGTWPALLWLSFAAEVAATGLRFNGGFGHSTHSGSHHYGSVEVVIGSSLNHNQKCVDPPGPVACPHDLMLKDRSGEYPDEFHVFHHGGQVCARRTDHNGGWGINVAVRCHKTSPFSGHYKDSSGEIVFGSNLNSATKCVDAPANVHCDDTAEQKGRTGEYPDKFHIYHDGSQICAHRTDASAGWGLHLVIQCRTSGGGGGFGGGLHGGGFPDDGLHGHGEVVFGSSLDSVTKCVDSPGHLHCDDTAKQVGRTGEYPDTFHIYHAGTQICAHRTDAHAGWGLHLVIHCRRHGGGSFGGGLHGGGLHGGGSSQGGEVVFGSSLDSATKCVDSPGRVHCDDTAQQVGRTGEYPDTFHIYHDGAQICAQRTDADAGWGLHLVVHCRGHSFGGGLHGEGSQVVIGTSPDSEIKCVDATPGVYCDDTAEQVGRTGEWPDTFHIYQEDGRICARRTDDPSGWGLNLVLQCKTYGPPPPGGFYRTAKVRHCCQEKLFSPACPYDCQEQMEHEHDSWSPTRHEWCCRNRALGCRPHEQPPPPLHDGGHGPFDCEDPDDTPSHAPLPDQQGGGGNWNPAEVDHPRYNCMHGSKEMWSQDKAQYCSLWLAASERRGASGGAAQVTYNCDIGDESSWSHEKIWWCQHHSGPHECDVDKKHDWSPDESDFCCIVKGIGCPKLSKAQAAFTQQHAHESDRNSWEDAASLDIIDRPGTLPAPEPEHHELNFDCLSKDNAEWSETKKRWCCAKWGLFCEKLGDFDCTTGLWNWRKGWSNEKKEFCCKKEGKGCEDKSYDCSQETTAINKDSREWCCENHLYSKACPFECRAGLDKWVVGFSPAKKEWCCKYEKLACVEHHSHPTPHPHPKVVHHTVSHVHVLPQPHLANGLIGGKTVHHTLHTHHVHHTLGRPLRKPEFQTLGRPLHSPQFHKDEVQRTQFGHSGMAQYTFADCQNENDRSEATVAWCCRMLGLCYLKVSFNCEVGLQRWHMWSPQKKSICCGKEVQCPQAHVVHHYHMQGFGSSGGLQGYHDVWYHGRDVEDLYVGPSPKAGTKCVTPSKPVMCPEDAGNERDDEYPDRFRVYRKGGQVCVDRMDYEHLWGLDLVLKCLKVDKGRFEQVRIGSSSRSSTKCVPQTTPVSCSDDAAQAGRTDAHPDTFSVYHSHGQICAKRIDADSHWGVDLVLYCRRGHESSGYWTPSKTRVLEDSYSEDVRDPGARRPLERVSWHMLAILPGFIALLLGALFYSMSCKKVRFNSLLLQADAAEDANSCQRKARTPWVSVPAGDEGSELEVA